MSQNEKKTELIVAQP